MFYKVYYTKILMCLSIFFSSKLAPKSSFIRKKTKIASRKNS